ncbi:MAG: CPBP family glutamic-type intramembrane protease, partial [Longimicrobiales bacterium]
MHAAGTGVATVATVAADRRAIVTYLLLTLALSAIFWTIMIRAGTLGVGGGIFVLLLMWCPGVSGLASQLIHHRTLRGLGWHWGSTRDQLISYFLPVLYGGVVYGMVWATGLGVFESARIPAGGMARFLAVVATLGFLQSLLSATGEEIGWRGFLVPHLSRVTSFRNTALISGGVWAVWHWPILLFADYNAGTVWWFGLACFSIMVVGLSFAMAWLRLHSGSLWTGAILHATHNLYIQGVFDRVTVDSG